MYGMYNLYKLNGSIIGHSDKIDYHFFFKRTVMNARIYYKALPLSSSSPPPFSHRTAYFSAFVQQQRSKKIKVKRRKMCAADFSTEIRTAEKEDVKKA